MPMDNCFFLPSTLNNKDICLYKYREANSQSLQSLILNQVWLSSPEKFNDPFEASALPIMRDSALKKIVEREKKKCGILCLCKEPAHLAMWSYYGAGLKGFVVGYNLLNLLQSITPTRNRRQDAPCWKYIIDVDYKDSLAKFNEGLLMNGGPPKEIEEEYKKIYATKSKIYEHEKECRIIFPRDPNSKDRGKSGSSGLYTHAADAISEIVFGELMDKDTEMAIRTIFKDRSVKFKRAKRIENSFGINIEDA